MLCYNIGCCVEISYALCPSNNDALLTHEQKITGIVASGTNALH